MTLINRHAGFGWFVSGFLLSSFLLLSALVAFAVVSCGNDLARVMVFLKKFAEPQAERPLIVPAQNGEPRRKAALNVEVALSIPSGISSLT
jgi:hypothetical protein